MNILTDIKRAQHYDFEKVFDTQIQILRERGCAEQIVDILKSQKYSVLKKASEMTIETGHIPFLPVIPRTLLSIYDQMPMVRNRIEVGSAHLDSSRITDVVKTPASPYYIFDIENGE